MVRINEMSLSLGLFKCGCHFKQWSLSKSSTKSSSPLMEDNELVFFSLTSKFYTGKVKNSVSESVQKSRSVFFDEVGWLQGRVIVHRWRERKNQCQGERIWKRHHNSYSNTVWYCNPSESQGSATLCGFCSGRFGNNAILRSDSYCVCAVFIFQTSAF